jgi:hypothetical protein
MVAALAAMVGIMGRPVVGRSKQDICLLVDTNRVIILVVSVHFRTILVLECSSGGVSNINTSGSTDHGDIRMLTAALVIRSMGRPL